MKHASSRLLFLATWMKPWSPLVVCTDVTMSGHGFFWGRGRWKTSNQQANRKDAGSEGCIAREHPVSDWECMDSGRQCRRSLARTGPSIPAPASRRSSRHNSRIEVGKLARHGGTMMSVAPRGQGRRLKFRFRNTG